MPHVEGGLHVLERKQGLDHRAGGCHQHEGGGDLDHCEDSQFPIRGSGDASGSAGQAESLGSSRRRQTRDECQQQCGKHGQCGAHPEHAGIQGEVQGAYGVSRNVARQNPHHRAGNQDSERSAADAQQQALGQQGTAQCAGARAQRRADTQFAFAAHGAGQNQVGDVGTGDDKHQHRRRHQDQQNGPRTRRELIAQAHRADAVVSFRRIGVRMLALHGSVYRAQLRARRFQIRARRQPGEQFRHAMYAAGHHGGRKMMRAGDDVGDDLGVLRIRDARLQNTHHRGRARIEERTEADCFAEHRRIALQRRRPESIGQDHRAGGIGAVILRIQQPAEDRTQPHGLEIGAAHHAGRHCARLSQSGHGEAERGEIAERGQSSQAGTQVLDFRHREVGVFVSLSGGALADVDQVIFVSVDQRAQQHRPHQAEHRGVGSDSQGQGEHNRHRQPFGARQGTGADFQFAQKRRNVFDHAVHPNWLGLRKYIATAAPNK